MKFTTIKDLAKKLGITHQTVSRALNNDPRVKGETAAKIKALATKMSYFPNAAARGLARARSNAIAIVTFSYFLLYPSEVMRGIEPEIGRSRFEMDYYNTQKFTFSGPDGKESYIFEKILDERRAGAVILISVNMPENTLSSYRKAGIHVVFIEVEGSWGHRVHYDNEMAARLAVDHLVERKRKNIGMMTGNTQSVRSFKERVEGFKKAMRSHGFDASNRNIFEFPEEYPELAGSALDFFLKNKIDAVYFGASDPYMLMVLKEARKRGLKVPDDLALVSQDDINLPLAADVTAVSQPAAEMGKKAVETAIRAIEGNDLKNMRDEMFYPELIVRKST